MNDEETADALDCAADYLRTFGLCKGELGGNGGPACALGALCEASEDYSSSAEAVRNTLGQFEIASWSDAPERTAEDVATAFQETAARLRQGEIQMEDSCMEGF